MADNVVILWDLDGTLLDFEAAEKICIPLCLKKQGASLDKLDFERYKVINRGYWKNLELGKITKEELYPGRFRDWFMEMGYENLDPVKMNEDYQIALGDNPVFVEGAMETLRLLREKGYRQYIVTNGSFVAQDGKLKKSGIIDVVDGVFVSEVIGTPKPQKEFFDYCEKHIEGYDCDRTVIIGDSLSSDIAGGNNAGIKTIWFNPDGREKKRNVEITEQVDALKHIPALLGKIFN